MVVCYHLSNFKKVFIINFIKKNLENMKKYIISAGALLLTPAIVLAAIDTSQGLGKVVRIVSDFISALVPVIISAAVLFFLYGLAKYMWSVGEEKEAGKDMMIWGIIGLFVMVSVWGLVNLISETLNLNDNPNIQNPTQQIPSDF